MAGRGRNVVGPRPTAGMRNERDSMPIRNGVVPQQPRQAVNNYMHRSSPDDKLQSPAGFNHKGVGDVQKRSMNNGVETTARNTARENGHKSQSSIANNQAATVDERKQGSYNSSRDMTFTALRNINLSPAGGGKRPQSSRPKEAQDEFSPIKKKTKKDEDSLKCHFDILLPNGTCSRSKFALTLATGGPSTVAAILRFLEDNYTQQDSAARKVQWGPHVKITDDRGNDLSEDLPLRDLVAQQKSHNVRLLLHDGHEETTHMDQQMWNVTPKPDMLGQLPQGYTMHTALADQVDNALQAVWHNGKRDRRLISVNLSPDKITIFDTGPGMDCSDEQGLSNWATVGSSTHRSEHHKAVGGQPPFLTPYLGKYGAGGPSAALHLGNSVTVWSKTKDSKLVWSLGLEQNVLVEKQTAAKTRIWRSPGRCRQMTTQEKSMSPHGSFTKVIITKLKPWYCILKDKQQYWTVDHVQELLKDIYYPYIQTETGVSSKTVYSVEFEVNGVNLLEIIKCETAIRKIHTCIGDPFVVDIYMKKPPANDTPSSSSSAAEEVANARITCHYYPTQKGKEALDSVVEELNETDPTIQRTYENLNRLTVRWLGRLLPDMKWAIFPFMEVPPKKLQKLGVQRVWAKRVAAFVDTDAGFHPTQSKTELDRDQPFVVALRLTGASDYSGTSALGTTVSLRLNGKIFNPTELSDAFLDWLKDMHLKYDEEFTFVDDGIYVFDCPNAEKELGISNKYVIFHKHMKYGQGEYVIDDANPVRIKLPKGTKGSSLKTDLYATVEYFFRDGADEEGGEVKFLCRSIDVPKEEGCSINANMRFERRKSLWFSAALLSSVKRLDAVAWKKKLEEISNKTPSHIEILNEDDVKKLEVGDGSDQILPFPIDGQKVEAGFTLPAELLVVVRPRRGSGPAHKQGMVVPDQLNLMLLVTRCNCTGFCWKRKGSLAPPGILMHSDDNHGEVVVKLKSAPRASNTGLKGLYTLRLESSEVRQLRLQGNYTFYISVVDDDYTGVSPVVSSIHVLSSKMTSKWTICNHPEDCASGDHDNLLSAPVIKLNEQLREDLYLQKYDQFGNPQIFGAQLLVKVSVVNPNGDSLGMETTTRAQLGKATANGYRLHVKNLLFERGALGSVERSYEGLLRVCGPDEQKAQMRCKVLPGRLASVKVTGSIPVIDSAISCFQELLLPNEVLKKLTLQGLDASGNIIDKGQKMRVLLKGLAFHDEHTEDREVDENGCLHLGGLIRVATHYNSSGSLSVVSGSSKLLEISFKTAVRKLIATGLPTKCYVGRQIEGVVIQIVDENGNVDVLLGDHNHSVALDWQTGVTYPLKEGRCVLPAFRLPETPGCWKGKVYFSANSSLAVTIQVEMELSEACSITSVNTEPIVAKCGVPCAVRFTVYDDEAVPAFLPEHMQQQIIAKVEAKDDSGRSVSVKCRGVKKSEPPKLSMYESHLILTGPIGRYVITLMDSKRQLQGRAETPCILEHGPVSRLMLTRVDKKPIQDLYKPLVVLEASRCKAMPSLSVALVDSGESVCTSCNDVVLIMSIVDCSEWVPLKAKVSKGIARYGSPPVLIPVGTYTVIIRLECLEKTCSFDASVEPPTTQYSLKVKHGNYPSALKLEHTTGLCISHSDSGDQRVPQMTVFVESADGRKLQNRPLVALRVHDVRSTQHQDEYDGTFAETLEAQPEPIMAQEVDQPAIQVDKYVFTGVMIPPKAGTYVMDFFVRNHDEVAVQSRYLQVKPGPPKKIEIRSMRGHKMESLCVQLLDAYGNICDNAPEMQMRLDLVPIGEDAKKWPCSVQSRKTAVTSQGQADFGKFQLSEGNSGIYTLTLRLKDTSGDICADLRILVTKGNISDDIKHQYDQLRRAEQAEKEFLDTCSNAETLKMNYERQLRSLEKDFRDCQETLRTCENEAYKRRQDAEHYGDKIILRGQSEQPVRTLSDVAMDIRSWASRTRNNASAALLEAMSLPSTFLTATSAGQDVIGMVVLLARVETDVLNKRLSSFLGPEKLVTIICRSQLGINAVDMFDENGDVDVNEGLHGFARSRGYRIDGNYRSLALTDIRPYRRKDRKASVDLSHPQRLLNIDPPVLADGQVPVGFLGYAVNLLHVNNDGANCAGLRESLFFHLFHELQVYDTRRNLNSAVEKLKEKFTGALSLDGAVIRRDKFREHGRRSENTSIRFGTVEYGERQNVSIVPPYCHAFRRESSLRTSERKIRELTNQLQDYRATVTAKRPEFQKLENYLLVLQGQRYQKAEYVQSIRRQVDELSEAASAIEMRTVQENQEMQAFHA